MYPNLFGWIEILDYFNASIMNRKFHLNLRMVILVLCKFGVCSTSIIPAYLFYCLKQNIVCEHKELTNRTIRLPKDRNEQYLCTRY